MKLKRSLKNFVRSEGQSPKYGVEFTGAEHAPFRIFPIGARSKPVAYIMTMSGADAETICRLINESGVELRGRAPSGNFTLQECRDEEYNILKGW